MADGGVVEQSVGAKATRIDCDTTGTVRNSVPVERRQSACLDDTDLARVVALGRRVASVLVGSQDVEWAVEGGEIWLLQARPVTVPLPATPGLTSAAKVESVSRTRPRSDIAFLTGTSGSSGTATGPARVVSGPPDFSKVRPGDIVVCRLTDPAWTPLLTVVAGVVTETGGLLSHAAIVAREQGIPAVLGLTGR